MSSFLLFPRSCSRLVPLFFVLVPIGVNAEGIVEVVVVECPVERCLLGLAVGSLVVECPVVGISLAVVGL